MNDTSIGWADKTINRIRFRAKFWSVFIPVFFGTVWQHNDYCWPGRRSTIRNAIFVATCIAGACVRVRYCALLPEPKATSRMNSGG